MLWRDLKKKSGFTLVEMSVVMGLLALLGALSLAGYLGSRKQIFITHVGNRLQSDIRQTFVDTISSKRENDTVGSCARAVNPENFARLKVIKVPLSGGSFQSYEIIPYCENGGLNPSTTPKVVNPSENLNYTQDLRVTALIPAISGVPLTSGTLYMVFNSPYGRFYYRYYTAGTEPTDANLFSSPPAWVSDTTRSYNPDPSDHSWNVDSSFDLTFDTDTSGAGNGLTQVLRISDHGNVGLQ